jgi:hypothetical protein
MSSKDLILYRETCKRRSSSRYELERKCPKNYRV